MGLLPSKMGKFGPVTEEVLKGCPAPDCEAPWRFGPWTTKAAIRNVDECHSDIASGVLKHRELPGPGHQQGPYFSIGSPLLASVGMLGTGDPSALRAPVLLGTPSSPSQDLDLSVAENPILKVDGLVLGG